MNANVPMLDEVAGKNTKEVIDVLNETIRQQQAEIEDLKNANRFIQNFAEEQHQRAVALEMRELTDEEIYQTWVEAKNTALNTRGSDFVEVIFARAILRKASEK